MREAFPFTHLGTFGQGPLAQLSECQLTLFSLPTVPRVQLPAHSHVMEILRT